MLLLILISNVCRKLMTEGGEKSKEKGGFAFEKHSCCSSTGVYHTDRKII